MHLFKSCASRERHIHKPPYRVRSSLSLADLAVAAFAVYCCITTSDSFAAARGIADPLLYVRVFEFAKLRLQEVLMLVLAVSVVGSVGMASVVRVAQTKQFVVLLFLTFGALIVGIAGARISGLPQIGVVGPEARGLLELPFVYLLLVSYLTQMPHRRTFLLAVIMVSLCIRSLYEIFALKSSVNPLISAWVVDQSTLFWIAVVAVILLAAAAEVPRRRDAIVLLAGSLLAIAIVIVSFRRSPAIVFLGGCLIILGRTLLIAFRMRIIAGTLLLIAVIGATGGLLTKIFPIASRELMERGASVVDTGEKNRSNLEHVNDAVEAWNLIQQRPVLGFGIGTYLPGRTLDIYGELIPIHSPQLHSWVRLGLLGIVGYLVLMVWMLYESFRRSNYQACPWGRRSAIGLTAFLWSGLAFPPFYLDLKQWFMVVSLMSIVASCGGSARPHPVFSHRSTLVTRSL